MSVIYLCNISTNNKAMTHYVCTGGCKGVSDDPNAACQSEECSKHAHPLTACNCEDGEHQEAYASKEENE